MSVLAIPAHACNALSSLYFFFLPPLPKHKQLARDVSKIEQILAMGFTDKKQVVKTLQSNHGDVQRTVDQLLVSKNGGQSVTPATTGAEEGVVGGGGVKSESSTTVTPPRPGSTDATSQTAIGGGGAGSFVANLTSFLRRTSSSGASSSSSSQKGTTAFGQGVSTASLGIGGWEDVNGSPLLTNASALLDLLELSSLKVGMYYACMCEKKERDCEKSTYIHIVKINYI